MAAGKGWGLANLNIVGSFLDLGDTFLNPDGAGTCKLVEAGVEGVADSVCMDCSCSVGSSDVL